MKIYLKNNNGFRWFEGKNLKVKGYLVNKNGILYKNEDLLDYFKEIKNENDLVNRLQNCNGSFSCIIDNQNKTYMIVDHIRSFPLFYLVSDELYISDQAQCLEELADLPIEKDALYEYLMTGYVTGENTLYKEIKQLKAGQYLVLDKGSNSIQLKRYYDINTNIKSKKNDISICDSMEVLCNNLYFILEEIFKELISSLEGKPVILPLSGGYDSRLIALFFKK